MLEARTFSPPAFEQPGFALPGHFRGLRRRSNDPDRAAAFWEALGLMPSPDAEGIREVCSEGFNLQFSRNGPDVALVFETPDLEARAAKLEFDGQQIERRGSAVHMPGPDGITLILEPAQSLSG
jgi:hypothetical protein